MIYERTCTQRPGTWLAKQVGPKAQIQANFIQLCCVAPLFSGQQRKRPSTMAFVNSMLCPKAEVGFALPHGDWPCLIFHCNDMDAMPTGWCIQSGCVVRLSMLAPRKDRKGLAWPHPLMSIFDFQNKSCMEMKRLCQDPMWSHMHPSKKHSKVETTLLVCSFCQTCVHSGKITAHHYTFIYG